MHRAAVTFVGGLIGAGAAATAARYFSAFVIRQAIVVVVKKDAEDVSDDTVDSLANLATAMAGATVIDIETHKDSIQAALSATAQSVGGALKNGGKGIAETAVEAVNSKQYIVPGVAVFGAVLGAMVANKLFSRLSNQDSRIAGQDQRIADQDQRIVDQDNRFSAQAGAANQRFLALEADLLQPRIPNLDRMTLEDQKEFLTCPITQDLMLDPVWIREDNRLYERECIEQHYNSAPNQGSPLSRTLMLRDPSTIPTHIQARNYIQAHRERLETDEGNDANKVQALP